MPSKVARKAAVPPVEAEIESDESEDYEVEKIVGERTNEDGETQYRIKWANFPDTANTWETEDHLKGCPNHLTNWNALKKLKQKEKDSAARSSRSQEWKEAVPSATKGRMTNGNRSLEAQSSKLQKGGKRLLPASDSDEESEVSLGKQSAVKNGNGRRSQSSPVAKTGEEDGSSDEGSPPKRSKLNQIPRKSIVTPKKTVRDLEEENGFDASDDDGYEAASPKKPQPVKKVERQPAKKPRKKASTQLATAVEDEPDSEDEPGPCLKTDKGEFWEVEEVIGVSVVKGRKSFLLKWKYWPEAQNTWEPASCMKQSMAAVNDFYEKHGKPKGKNAKVLSEKGRRYETLYGTLA